MIFDTRVLGASSVREWIVKWLLEHDPKSYNFVSVAHVSLPFRQQLTHKILELV